MQTHLKITLHMFPERSTTVSVPFCVEISVSSLPKPCRLELLVVDVSIGLITKIVIFSASGGGGYSLDMSSNSLLAFLLVKGVLGVENCGEVFVVVVVEVFAVVVFIVTVVALFFAVAVVAFFVGVVVGVATVVVVAVAVAVPVAVAVVVIFSVTIVIADVVVDM